MIYKSLALLTLIAPFFQPIQDDTYSLKYKEVVGDESLYEINMDMEFEGFQMTMFMKHKVKVLKVEEDGAYEAEETSLEGVMKFNGTEQAIPAEEPKINKYDKNGKSIKKEGEEEDEDPMSQLLDALDEVDPEKPVKIGEEWTTKNKMVEVKAKLVGKEVNDEVPCLKVELSGKVIGEGTAGDITGTVYLRASDFKMKSAEFKLDNAKLDAESPAGKLAFKMILKN
jgi:hypothetical protein